jgi:hypothetical protein
LFLKTIEVGAVACVVKLLTQPCVFVMNYKVKNVEAWRAQKWSFVNDVQISIVRGGKIIKSSVFSEVFSQKSSKDGEKR